MKAPARRVDLPVASFEASARLSRRQPGATPHSFEGETFIRSSDFYKHTIEIDCLPPLRVEPLSFDQFKLVDEDDVHILVAAKLR